MIFIEAFKNKGGADYLEKFNRFTVNNIFAPSVTGGVHSTWQKAGTGRMGESISNYLNGRYNGGYNIQNA